MTGTPPPLPPGPPHDPYAGAPAGSRFFDGLRARPWRRPVSPAIGGVCAAVADHYGVDRVLVRVAVVLVGLFVNPLLSLILVGYAAGWLLIPDQSGRILAEATLRGRWSWPLAGAVLLGIIGLASIDTSLRVGFGSAGGWVTLLVLVTAGIVIYLLRGRENRPAGPPPATWAPPAGTQPAAWAPPSGPPVMGGQPSAPGGPAWEPQQPHLGYPAPGPAGHPAAGSPAPSGAELDDESTISLAKRPAPGSHPAAPETDTDKDSAMMTMAPPSGPPWTPPPPAYPAPPQPRAPRRPAAGATTFALVAGLTLLVTGGVLVAGVLGALPDMFLAAEVAAIAALSTVAISIIVVGLSGRRAGALSVLAVLALFGLIATSSARAGTQYWESGRAQWAPQTWSPEGQILESQTYRADFGDRVLDLSQVQKLSPGQSPRTITMDVDMGEATIRVPEGLTVALDLKADMGSIDLPGNLSEDQVETGDDASVSAVRTIGQGPADVTVVARVDAGNITVEQTSAQAAPAATPEQAPSPEQTPSPEPAQPAPNPEQTP